jgi:uncharacterized protein (UPF0332 family)
MPLDELDNLAKIGRLKREPSDPRELAALIQSGEARLKDAANSDLSLESRFDLAYNAAHAFALAALRFRGYRSDKRYLVFEVLVHTANLAPEKCRVLDDAHRKRNAAEYAGVVDISESVVVSTIDVAKEVVDRVRKLVAR